MSAQPWILNRSGSWRPTVKLDAGCQAQGWAEGWRCLAECLLLTQRTYICAYDLEWDACRHGALIYDLLIETMSEPNMKDNTLLALHPTLKYVAVVFYWDKFYFYELLLPMTSMHPPRQMLMRKTQRPVSALLFNIKIVLTIYTAFSAYLLTSQIGVIYLANAALR